MYYPSFADPLSAWIIALIAALKYMTYEDACERLKSAGQDKVLLMVSIQIVAMIFSCLDFIVR